MLDKRYIGHNVLHLFYPVDLKVLKSHPSKNKDWEEIYTYEKRDTGHKENIRYIFSDEYNTSIPDSDEISYRKWIDNGKFFNYFHPNIRNMLFFDKNKKFRAYRKIRKAGERNIFYGEFYELNEDTKKIQKDRNLIPVLFEVISNEIYLFNNDKGFLVIRLCLLENYKYSKQDHRFHKNKGIGLENNVTLDIWHKFVIRISQNYPIYETDPVIKVAKLNTDMFQNQNDHITIEQDDIKDMKLFFEYVKELLDVFNHVEPVAFVHSFVQINNISKKIFTTRELYKLASLNDFEGNSGDQSFKESFLSRHLWERWVPDTYYTGIDYGTVTLQNIDRVSYSYHEEHYSSFADLIYQQHTRHYLIFILLSLYYRNFLQELSGRYAELQDMNNKQDLKKANEIISEYYNLNQQHVVGRITHNIDGIEKWNFYRRVLGIENLYSEVQKDMKELNQRKLEALNESQNKEIHQLTIIAAITGIFGMNLILNKNGWDEVFTWNMVPQELFDILFWLIQNMLNTIALLAIFYIFSKYFFNVLFKFSFRKIKYLFKNEDRG